jgi:hypothetical protein
MGATEKDRITDAAVSPASVLVARASGTIEMYALVRQLSSSLDDSELAKFTQFLRSV